MSTAQDLLNAEISRVRNDIRDLENQLRADPYGANASFTRTQKMMLERLLQELLNNATAPPPPPPPDNPPPIVRPSIYREGTQIRLKSSKFLGRPKEGGSLTDGLATWATVTDKDNDVINHIIAKPATTQYVPGSFLNEFFIYCQLARNDSSPHDGREFGRYGDMFLSSSSNRNLLYLQHWLVDPNTEFGRKRYDGAAWTFYDLEGNATPYPALNTWYKIRNKKDDKYLREDGEYLTTVSSWDSAGLWRIEVAQHQDPQLPDRSDFIRSVADRQNEACANLTRDSPLTDVMACTTKELGKEVLKRGSDQIPDLIPWWVYAIGAVVAIGTVKSLVR